jgi:hypothetical protein
VTNTDGAFAALPEIAQEKFLPAFSFAYQTFEPADFRIAVFRFTGRRIRFIRGQCINEAVSEFKTAWCGHEEVSLCRGD